MLGKVLDLIHEFRAGEQVSLDLICVPVEHLVRIRVKISKADFSVFEVERTFLIRDELVSRGVNCHCVTTAFVSDIQLTGDWLKATPHTTF
jgi:hypothetical protein